jgi:hypothetical protein
VLCSLALLVAVNERDQWGPRMARAIPRRWWLRWPAFLLYSGAFGGVLFTLLLFGLVMVAVQFRRDAVPTEPEFMHVQLVGLVAVDWRQIFVETMGVMVLYVYCYALTAAWIRRVFLPRLPGGYTWIVFLILLAAGMAVPFLMSFLLFNPSAPYAIHVPWLLPNPGVALGEFGNYGPHCSIFLTFAGSWAVVITLASVPWFVRQVRGFRPFTSAAGRSEMPPTLTIPGGQMDTTKTAL